MKEMEFKIALGGRIKIETGEEEKDSSMGVPIGHIIWPQWKPWEVVEKG